jgi:hypothetical protein
MAETDLRSTSEHDKGVSCDDATPDHPGQIARREHWRKADRDDRGPESRLLPVEERTGEIRRDRIAGVPDPVTPQRDDPAGQGYAGSPVASSPSRPTMHANRHEYERDRNANSDDPHPDDPQTVKGGSANPGSAYGVAQTKARPGNFYNPSGGSGFPGEGANSAGTAQPGFVGQRTVPGGEG